MVALLGGRMPHLHGILAGGAAAIPTQAQIRDYAERFRVVRRFVEEKYLPITYLVTSKYRDLGDTARGYATALCMGVFPLDDEGGEFLFNPGAYYEGKDHPFDPMKIREYMKYSWFDDATSGRMFSEEETVVDVNKAGAYSFSKAPRYDGPRHGSRPARPHVGEQHRAFAHRQEARQGTARVDAARIRDLGENFVFSIMGRHLARAEEAWQVVRMVEKWLGEISPDGETFAEFEVPESGEGFAFTEAPRGCLLHYMRVRDHKVDNYQILPATLWNCCPRDDMGRAAPWRKPSSAWPVPDASSPVNVGRVIRAFDP